MLELGFFFYKTIKRGCLKFKQRWKKNEQVTSGGEIKELFKFEKFQFLGQDMPSMRAKIASVMIIQYSMKSESELLHPTMS